MNFQLTRDERINNLFCNNGIFRNLTATHVNFSTATGVPSYLTSWYPTYTGEPKPNIFKTFEEAYENMKNIGGQKLLMFEGGGTFVIPSGSWDMTDVTWYVNTVNFNPIVGIPPTIIQIDEGVTLPNLISFNGPMRVRYTGVSPCIVLSGSTTIFSERLTSFECTSTGSLFRFIGDSVVTLFVLYVSSMFISGPIIDIATTNSFFIIGIGESSGFQPNTIVGTVFAFVLSYIQPSAAINFPFVISTELPSLSYSAFLIINNVHAPKTVIKDYSPSSTNDNSQGFQQCDMWTNTNNNQVYVNANPTTGAAIWKSLGSHASVSTITGVGTISLTTNQVYGEIIVYNDVGANLDLPSAASFVGSSPNFQANVGQRISLKIVNTGAGAAVVTTSDINTTLVGDPNVAPGTSKIIDLVITAITPTATMSVYL